MRGARIAKVAVAAAMAVLLAAPLPAVAAPSSASSVAARIRQLNAQVAGAGRAYEKAQWALEDTEAEIASTDRSIAITSKQLAAARAKLRGRASDIYRAGDIDVVTLLLGSSSVTSLLARVDYFSAIADHDADAVSSVKRLGAKLRADRKRLSAARASMAARVRARRQQRNRLQAQLASKQAEYARLKAELAAALAREQASSGVRLPAGSVSAGANGMVFPVAGPNYYSDTWGAPRSGGRSHKGTDVMAASGVPVVATVSGTVSSKEGGLGGKVIWLRGSGWSMYYAHLSGWAVRSGSVHAGQVIGYVGATGNAAGGSPHLHFEMHPGGGGAVDPYPYLRGMQ
jgi:murein DD-endopeptidase MepM/ murein hydrolase activator NlpD